MKGKSTEEMLDVVGNAMATVQLSAIQASILYDLDGMANGTVSEAQINSLKKRFLAVEADGRKPDLHLAEMLRKGEKEGELKCCLLYSDPPHRNTGASAAAARLSDAAPPPPVPSPTPQLLAAAYVTAESHRKALLNPDVMYCDIAESTNSEGMPLLLIILRDGNGNLIQALTVYLWCKRDEAFTWVFGTAIPQIYGRKWCAAVCTIIMDRDPQQARVSTTSFQKDLTTML